MTKTYAWLMLVLTVLLSAGPLAAQVLRQAPPPATTPAAPAQQPATPASPFGSVEEHRQSLGSWEIDFHAFVALPLATGLGGALGLRP